MAGAPNFGTDGMREQLFALQLQEQELLVENTADHPLLKQIRQQIEFAKRILAMEDKHRTETTRGRNPNYDAIRLQVLQKQPELSALNAKVRVLETERDVLRKDLQGMNNSAIEMGRLERELEICDANYRKYTADAEQARIDHSLEIAKMSNISIAQPATLDFYPSSPKVLLTLMLGTVRKPVFASIGLAFASDSRRLWKKRHKHPETGNPGRAAA